MMKKAEVKIKNEETNWRTRLVLHSSFFILHSLAAHAAEDEIPQLAPPCPVLPPTFWEQNGASILWASITALLLVILIVWLKLRPRPAAVIPPEVQARRALEALRSRPEDGAALSEVSHTLHRYFRAAFELPPGELTTTEFCRVLTSNEKIGPELSAATADLLRRCDDRKFSKTATEPLGAATKALELVALAEARRNVAAGGTPDATSK